MGSANEAAALRPQKASVACGLDRFLESGGVESLRGARVGVLAHAASVTRDFVHVIDALIEQGAKPARLFGPEHGLRGSAQDMIAVDSDVDPLTGIEVRSLYGETFESLAPKRQDLVDLDCVLIDLQDVGSRYYTYVYTALMTARACDEAGVRAIVLDRPNPIGASIAGPRVHDGFRSFVGMLDLPMRHGLTVGEVLRYAAHAGEGAPVEVVAVSGWDRRWYADQHDAPWVLPSPNMPTLDTAIVYPGQCLLEGTNLSEGRGTTRPFELFGAPYVDAGRLRDLLVEVGIAGASLRATTFEPTFQKWAKTPCNGLQLHVRDRESFEPVRTSVAILWACRQLFPDGFAWRAQAYEFVDEIPAIDLLFGSDRPRRLIDDGASFDRIVEEVVTPAALRRDVEAARDPRYDGTDA